MPNETPLSALVINCTLSPSPASSSSELLASQLQAELEKLNVESSIVRAVDFAIKPGVAADMGAGDAWPDIRKQMLAADILIIATPTWMGQMSSEAQRVMERLDAELSETDDLGRLLTYGKVAAAVVVGNEDGAHHVSSQLFQCLNDVGFTLAAGAVTYWNGEAMHKTDYKDLEQAPDIVVTTTKTVAVNTAHLARLLKQHPYPAST